MRRSGLSFFCCLSMIFIFFLASCGAKKKTAYSGEYVRPGTSSPTKKEGHSSSHVQTTYAALLGVDAKELNLDLYRYIDEWKGIPHRLGGQTKEGIDCSAFVGNIYREVYQKNLGRSSRDMAEQVKRKYDDQLKEGDLVFFSFGGKQIDHVGVYLHNGKFVHVSTKQGVVISNLKDVWYYKFLTRCGTPII